MSGKKPTPEQKAARDRGNKEILNQAAKQGNAKAKQMLTIKGGKK